MLARPVLRRDKLTIPIDLFATSGGAIARQARQHEQLDTARTWILYSACTRPHNA